MSTATPAVPDHGAAGYVTHVSTTAALLLAVFLARKELPHSYGHAPETRCLCPRLKKQPVLPTSTNACTVNEPY